MGALPQYYVDPNSGSDSTGDGLSDSSAWASLQHAADTITPNAMGDQINLKAGTADVLTGHLDFSTYNPQLRQKLIVRGYTTSSNDGGIGTIDGNATYQIGALNTVALIDLEIKNMSSTTDGISTVGNYSQLINCFIHTINRDAIGTVFGRSQIIDCRFENISRSACRGFTGLARNCYFANGDDYSFTNALNLSAQGHLFNCFFNLSGSSNGVNCVNQGHATINCTFFGGGSSGTGYINESSDGRGSTFAENIVAGFSGTGGKGCNNLSDWGLIFRNNSFHDNETDIVDPSQGDEAYGEKLNNESLSSSPFALSGANNFANRLAYFEPQDVGDVLSGDIPRGAAPQSVSSTGGTVTKHPLVHR